MSAACPYSLSLDHGSRGQDGLFCLWKSSFSSLSAINFQPSHTRKCKYRAQNPPKTQSKWGKICSLSQSECGLMNESCLMYLKIYSLFLLCKTWPQLAVLIQWKFHIYSHAAYLLCYPIELLRNSNCSSVLTGYCNQTFLCEFTVGLSWQSMKMM